MLQKILNLVSKEFEHNEHNETDSEEFKIQCQKCQFLFDELASSLNEEQEKQLLGLDSEYFKIAGQWKDDGYKDGLKSGFKLAVQLILDSLRN